MYRTVGKEFIAITINSSLTQCTVGADQMLIYVHAIAGQYTTVHIVACSVISKQQSYPTLNTHYHNQNNSVQLSSVLKDTEN